MTLQIKWSLRQGYGMSLCLVIIAKSAGFRKMIECFYRVCYMYIFVIFIERVQCGCNQE